MDKNQQMIVENFKKSLEEFDQVLAQALPSELDWIEKPGEWTVRQVIHHVTEDLTVYGFIIERALATPGSKVVFGEFPGNETWAESLGFDRRPVENAISLLHAQRAYFAELISHFPEKWGNKAVFYDESGKQLAESTVHEMIVMLTDHMREHTDMIENILNANLD